MTVNDRQEPLGALERGWLIEPTNITARDPRAGKYWRLKPGMHSVIGDTPSGPCWVSDHLTALRFARREDAEAYIAAACLGQVQAVEHLWVEGVIDRSAR